MLEAIYVLGRGNSFRKTGSRSLIQDGADELAVFARIKNSSVHSLGLSRSRSETKIRINGADGAGMEQALRAFPSVVIEPGQHRLFEDGPILRRQFLDWTVFHVEPQFLAAWRKFARCLRQRNRALRLGDRRSSAAWIEPLAESGEMVNGYRQEVMDRLRVEIQRVSSALLGSPGVDLAFRSGWSAGEKLVDVLARTLRSDLERGHTQAGPHRAELVVTVSGKPVRDVLSRGQQKLVLAAFVVGQLQVLQNFQTHPLLLVDDFGSELGPDLRARLWGVIVGLGSQVFVTALEESQVFTADAAMFHVKHGHVAAML